MDQPHVFCKYSPCIVMMNLRRETDPIREFHGRANFVLASRIAT